MNRFTAKVSFVLLTTVILTSCIYEREEIYSYNMYYSQYEPVILERNALNSTIKFTDVQEMRNAGKIYVKDDYIFIVDTNKGIHIYDNQQPQSPSTYAFIEMPGVTDLAIRDEYIYINQATDLVALTVDFNSKNIQVNKRISNTFPIKASPDGYTHQVSEDKVVVDWIKRNDL